MAGRMPRPLRPALVWTGGLVLVVAALALTMHFGWWGKAPAPASSLAAGTTPSPSASPTPSGSPSPSPSSPNPSGMPSRISVTTTAGITLVDAKIIPVQLKSDGALEPPFGVVGWYAGSGWPKPGWPGASILAGHINSAALGPDTFAKIIDARPGDRIEVRFDSGDQVSFTVTKSAAESKVDVPGDKSIWDAGNPRPLLRLITCDPGTPLQGGHYEGNWVVWADLASAN
ncbi:MAG TPA: class F sortase [Phycicoccus sp.]|nr:class F sortase [Phycicoccus sp.]